MLLNIQWRCTAHTHISVTSSSLSIFCMRDLLPIKRGDSTPNWPLCAVELCWKIDTQKVVWDLRYV